MLKAYNQDYAYYKHWFTKYSTPKEATKYTKKLLKHFKIQAEVYFNSYKKGFASYKGYIRLPKKNIPLAMIAHEIGHLLAYKNGYKGHTKKAYKYIHRVYRYSTKYIPIKILFEVNNKQLLLERRINNE